MPRKNIQVNNDLDLRVKAYCERNKVTYTSAVNVALTLLLYGAENWHAKKDDLSKT